jgi:hypothetical protein
MGVENPESNDSNQVLSGDYAGLLASVYEGLEQ